MTPTTLRQLSHVSWRYVALCVPFAYFFASRVPTAAGKVGWSLNYLLPVLALAAAAHGDWLGLLPALVMLVAVYAAYEFGYMVNDSVAIDREAVPTLRLDEAARTWMRAHLGIAFTVRALIGLACLALLHTTHMPQPTLVAAGWLLLWPGFALYNHWRGRITIALHFVLVSLRFVLPILAAAAPGSIEPGAALLLLALYPVPFTYEAAWKTRYGLPALKAAFGDEDRFRVTWYLTLLLATALWWPTSPQAGTSRELFLAIVGYFLLQRVLAWFFRRHPQWMPLRIDS